MNDLDLTPPPCLDIRNREKPAPYRAPARAGWRMPPEKLENVRTAIGRGHNTLIKLRRVRGLKLTDRQIRECLDWLRRHGAVRKTGQRTYELTRKTP